MKKLIDFQGLFEKIRMTCLLKFREVGAVQKSVNLVDLVKSFHKSTHLQKSAAIQPRTLSPLPRFGGASQFHPFLHPAPSPHSRTPEPVPAAPPPPPCVSAVLSMAFWYLGDLPFFGRSPAISRPVQGRLCARTNLEYVFRRMRLEGEPRKGQNCFAEE